MKRIGIKKFIAIFAILIIFATLISFYYLNDNSTNVPKSATLVKILTNGWDTNV